MHSSDMTITLTAVIMAVSLFGFFLGTLGFFISQHIIQAWQATY